MKYHVVFPVVVSKASGTGVPIPVKMKIEIDADSAKEAAQVFEDRLQVMVYALELR